MSKNLSNIVESTPSCSKDYNGIQFYDKYMNKQILTSMFYFFIDKNKIVRKLTYSTKTTPTSSHDMNNKRSE